MNKIYGLNVDMLRLYYEIRDVNNVNIVQNGGWAFSIST